MLLGNGDGSFAAAVTFATGTGSTAIATTDVDGDGNLDFIVANGGGNDLTILRGAGNGWFGSGSPLATGGSPAGVVAADFDGNGIADLAATNSADNTVGVFLGAAGPTPNPVPTLAGLAPSTAVEWGGDFTLTVNGTNFIDGSVVRWNGSDRPTTYVSATQVTASIPAADLVTPGTATVTVFNPAPGGGASNGAAFTISVPATPPTVTSVVPNSGPLAGGTTVTIGGTGFVAGATSVTIGSYAATGVVVGSATSLTAVTPSSAGAGARNVFVTTPAGQTQLTNGFTYLSVPSVSGVTPSAGPLSGGTTVTITGSGFFAGGTAVTIGGVPATGVVVGSANSLTAVTPAGTAGPKDVVVTTVGGSGTLTSGFTYRAAPSVSGMTPDTGPAAGGTSVTITGSGFVSGATTVTIGGAAATGVVVGSASSLTAVTPAGTAGPRDVAVTTAGGSATLTGAFTYLAAPTVSEVTPNSGSLAGGATVTVTGSGFIVGATTVTIGGVAATGVVVANASSLTAVTPAGTAGPRNVVVTTAGGSGTLAGGFIYLVAPAVSGLTPGSGPLAGGTTVTISGGAFVAGGTTVTVGGVAATGVVVGSASSLTAVTPAGTAGPKDVVVTTAGGSGTLTSGFIYRAAPSVSGITPDNGPTSGGTTVTITGGEFVAGGTTVTIGGAAATGVVVGSVSSLTAVTPAGTAGPKDVAVTTAGGSGTLTSAFTYLAAPTVSEITPNSGPLAGATTVTISGSGFVSGGTTVTIGGAAATGVVVLSASSLTAVTPAGTAGPRNVVVTTAGGSGTLESGFEYLLAPAVRSVAPEAGPLAGGTTVTVNGSGFVTGATAVTIGGVAATAVVVTNGNWLTAVTPAGSAGPKDVVVTTPGGSATLAGGFTYLAAPTVSGVTPGSGPPAGGTTVTITGSGFVAYTTTVTIGGVAAAGVLVGSAGSLTAITPAGTAGAKVVVVTTPGGAATLTGGFTYLAAPTVSGVAPGSGPWGGGTTVTITGSGFVAGATAVWFGSIPATGVIVSTGSSLTAVTPAGAAAGPTNVVVTTPGGSGTLAGGFTYINTCTSFSIEPTSAPSATHLAGSATVTVTGGQDGCTGGSWTAAGNGSWLSVSPTSGSGSGSVTVSWTENASGAPRTGTATIAGSPFTVVQGSSQSNDSCSSATLVTPLPFTATQDTSAATTETGDPSPRAGAGAHSVWYRFTAPRNGRAVIDTLGSTYNTVLTVFTGTCGGWTQVAGNDDASGTLQSQLTLAAAGGTTYGVMVTSFDATGGQLTFNLGYTAPAATADFNGDGKPDILWRNDATGQNVIWLMDGTTKLSEVTLPAVPDTQWQIVAVADLNADSKPDILWRHAADGRNVVWFLDGTTFTSQGFLPPVADTAWRLAAVADFNADTTPDLVWRNGTTGQNVVWYLDGITVLSQALLAPVPDTAWQLTGAADFNGDQAPDLLWRNGVTGLNVVWYMNGATYQSQVLLPPVADTAWHVGAVQDMNADGQVDLVWRNGTTGQNAVWFLNGVTLINEAALPPVGTPWDMPNPSPAPIPSPATPFDFDGNGYPDILWRHATTGQNVVWTMTNATVLSQTLLPLVADTAWQPVAVADLNADGDQDIVWRHAGTGMNVVWFMNGTTFVSQAMLPAVADTGWQIVGAADFNADTRPDLVWRHATSGQNVVWFLNGTTIMSQTLLPPVPDTAWEIVATVDFNGDRQPDLVWRNATTGMNLVWYMNGATFLLQELLPAVGDPAWRIGMAADFNRDGSPDLMWRNYTTGLNVVWYLNGVTFLSQALLPTVDDVHWVRGPKTGPVFVDGPGAGMER